MSILGILDVCVLCQHLLVPLVLVLLRSVKAKTLFLLQVWELPFVPLLVWDPYWMVPANVQSSLSAAATAVPSSSEQSVETSSESAESSQSVESSQPAETSSEQPSETSSETSSQQLSSITSAPDSSATSSSSTTSTFIRTASINGFADKLYDQLPECAKPCMFQNTGITPCPYWDAGCLCVLCRCYWFMCCR